jgi:protein gp37
MPMIDLSNGRYWDEGPMVVKGCTKVSPGCDHCWSLGMTRRYQKDAGFVQGHEWTGKIVCSIDPLLKACKGRPKVISLWNDIAHDEVPDYFFSELITTIASYPQHTFLGLTKRPRGLKARLHGLEIEGATTGIQRLDGTIAPWPLSNFWPGTTVENQVQEQRIIDLLQIPAAHRFLSLEPILSHIEVSPYIMGFDPMWNPEDGVGDGYIKLTNPGIDLVILGGESGPRARPVFPDDVRSVRDQCVAAGVPFFFKSWGKQLPSLSDCLGDLNPGIYRAITGHWHRHLDGRTYDDLPWVAQ